MSRTVTHTFMEEDDDDTYFASQNLTEALRLGHLDEVKRINNKMNYSITTEDGYSTQIETAAKYGQLEVVKFLAHEMKAPLNAKDSALEAAVGNMHTDVVLWLLTDHSNIVPVNTKTKRKALRIASSRKHLDPKCKLIYELVKQSIEEDE